MDPDEIKNVEQQIARLSPIVELANNQGWKNLVELTEYRMKGILASILNEVDPIKVVRLQESYKAFNTVLLQVEDSKNELELKQAELSELEQFNKYGQAGRPQGE